MIQFFFHRIVVCLFGRPTNVCYFFFRHRVVLLLSTRTSWTCVFVRVKMFTAREVLTRSHWTFVRVHTHTHVGTYKQTNSQAAHAHHAAWRKPQQSVYANFFVGFTRSRQLKHQQQSSCHSRIEYLVFTGFFLYF